MASTSSMTDAFEEEVPSSHVNETISLTGKSNLSENLTDFRSDIYTENNGNQFPVEVEEILLEKLNLSLMLSLIHI